MNSELKAVVSPKFGAEKLESPSDVDLIDVYEDIWQGYVFDQAKRLLECPHGDLSAMMLLGPYFEAAWIYATGESSDRRSKDFFVNGFLRVFRSSPDSEHGPEAKTVAEAIYKHLRCSLAHTGMVSFKVNYSRMGSRAFFVTYPKKPDGSLNFEATPRSIVVNPVRLLQGAELHFTKHVEILRSGSNAAVLDSFRNAATKLWGLGEPDNIIGMTEDEYLGRA